MTVALLFALALNTQCPTVTVRQQADTLVTESNRTQGPRRTVVRRLAQRIHTLCPTTGPVPVPVPVPPGPTPPPAPVTLPTPISIAPGSGTSPGPELVSVTPTFSWSAVSGATGYVLAIRDVASGSIVYPSSTGVGPPIPATAFQLPAGVLGTGTAYRWDVTAVSASTKSLASADRYFTTAAPVPVPVPVPPPTGIAAPELPRVVPAFRDPYPGRSCTVTVAAGGNVGTALSTARGGSVVCLTAGMVYAPLTLPARAASDTGWIVLRTAGISLPPEGVRIRPSTATGFAKIVTTLNAEPAFFTAPGTFGYFVRGIEITTGAGVSLTYALVELGSYGTAQDVMSEVPQRLILSQMYIHGSTNGEMQRCLFLNSGSTAIVDSWLSDCHGQGYDSQAIASFNGPGPHLVRNNYLEGVGENLMYGGATPSIPGLVASDITFTRNHVYTPVSWKGVWTKKNLLELKNAVRVLIDSSVFDGSWTDGQDGPALLFKSINDQGNCRWCRTTDVTVRRSYITHSSSGIVFSGAEGGVDTVAKRFLIQDVVMDSLNQGPYFSGGARGILITGGPSDIVFDRTVLAGQHDAALVLDMVNPSLRTMFRNSVFTHGQYFASASGPGIGLPSMEAGIPGFQWQSMTVVRGSTLDPLPAGTTVVSAETAAAAAIRATVSASVAGVVVPP